MKALLMVLALQDDAAKAKQLLEAAAAPAKDAPSVAFECQSKWKGVDLKQKAAIRAKRPDLVRIELVGGDQEYLCVLDGKSMWVYLKASNQYVKSSPPPLDTLGFGPLFTILLGKSEDVLKEAKNVSVREERAGDERWDVIGWSGAQDTENKLYLDSKRKPRRFELRVRMGGETYEQTVEYGAIDLAPKIAEDAFTFVPPKGATEMNPRTGKEELLPQGTDGPDFEATGLDGKKVKLSEYKGKPVLLNFWFHG